MDSVRGGFFITIVGLDPVLLRVSREILKDVKLADYLLQF
jgi:hypothetical protein